MSRAKLNSFAVFQVEYAVWKRLGGAMVWSIDTDDFDGACGGSKYPLLQSINSALAHAGAAGTMADFNIIFIFTLLASFSAFLSNGLGCFM